MSSIAWTKHARERSANRRITPTLVERIARRPDLTLPGRGSTHRCVSRVVHDHRWRFCVVVIEPLPDGSLRVVTAYWYERQRVVH